MCEKCDDRASGRLDCDLTSERDRKTRKREREQKREREVEKEWVRVGRGRGGTDGTERRLQGRGEE